MNNRVMHNRYAKAELRWVFSPSTSPSNTNLQDEYCSVRLREEWPQKMLLFFSAYSDSGFLCGNPGSQPSSTSMNHMARLLIKNVVCL